MDNQKQFKDNVYELLKESSREKFREFIQYNSGGIIILGIKENTDGTTEPIGIEKFEDNANINSLIKKYIPSTLEYNLYNFDFNSSEYDKLQNKKFQIIVIKDIPQINNKGEYN